MAFKLTPAQWQGIHAYQAREMELLASNAEFAQCAAQKNHYSRIGEWITLDRGKRVLELGCGPGRYVALLANLGFDVVGADPCPAANFPTWKLIASHQEVEFRDRVCAEDLPFEDNSFDQIACLGALLYFSDPSRALSEMRRVLKPGGRLIMRTVNRHNLYRLMTGKNIDPAASNAYTAQELKQLLAESGFLMDRLFRYGFYPPLFTGMWWRLVNGVIPIRVQGFLSFLTPPSVRVNLTAFCSAPNDA
jgi:ubiquinone/menaquinone biosynthesis C-methylase UbiE